jgi:hypothetical protein
LIQNATTGKNQPAQAMIGDDPVQLFSNFSLTSPPGLQLLLRAGRGQHPALSSRVGALFAVS